ncbi:MAG: sensor histidine kinase [Maritimibacter sp.]|nr:sensor histidine kinase [Maritimibacter sp.]
MRRRALSLRLRLFIVILTPLVLMALLMGFWRFSAAQNTAEDLFDRTLLSAALAISRDVAVSGGDALSLTTREMIRDAAGGEVFYHATGPGGIYVTGFAYPPIARADQPGPDGDLHYFEAVYRNEPVRVLQITERVTFETITGDTTVTVWQRLADRNAFAVELAVRAAAIIGVLLVTLALVVWFGVGLGLRPLTDLHEAIAARSPDDLSTIKRPVPVEVRGIVATLNRLFDQVERSITAQKDFIANAAHQLRNPAAAVQSMAEALQDARTEADRVERTGELVAAARSSARITNQLLSLERLQAADLTKVSETFDLGTLTRELCAEIGPSILSRGIDFELIESATVLPVNGDRVFICEAVRNLIDNALKHGGPRLSSISVELAEGDGSARVTVKDDGIGLSPQDRDAAFGRFSQVKPAAGSGLGLAITASVAERHGGKLQIERVAQGARISLDIPVAR